MFHEKCGLSVFNVYQKSHSIDEMHKQFVKSIEESGQIGKAPREVNMARWTDPDYKKKKKGKKKSVISDEEKEARRKKRREKASKE